MDKTPQKSRRAFREERMSATGAVGHADKVNAAIQTDEAARSALVASWRRSAAPPSLGSPTLFLDAARKKLSFEKKAGVKKWSKPQHARQASGDSSSLFSNSPCQH